LQALEASSETIANDYIDLYWVHIWDGITPVEEVMRGLDDLVLPRQGFSTSGSRDRSRHGGSPRPNTLGELRGWTRFIGLQIEYSLGGAHGVEREADSHWSKALNLGVLAVVSLGERRFCPGSITVRGKAGPEGG